MQSTGGKLEESYILVIAREIAKGLRAIHDSGIIHRDLKGEAYYQSLFFISRIKSYLYMEPEADRPYLVQLPTSWCMKKAVFRSSTLALLV